MFTFHTYFQVHSDSESNTDSSESESESDSELSEDTERCVGMSMHMPGAGMQGMCMPIYVGVHGLGTVMYVPDAGMQGMGMPMRVLGGGMQGMGMHMRVLGCGMATGIRVHRKLPRIREVSNILLHETEHNIK